MRSKKILDSFSHVLNVRISENQFDYIVHKACLLNVTPSVYVRMLIDFDRSRGISNEYKKSDFDD